MGSELKMLIDEAKKGDKNAFGKIYRLFLVKIYRYIYYSVRNREIAEDLAQETFLKCWRALSSFSAKKGSFSSFLFAIARNLVIDWSRKKKQISLEAVKEYKLIDTTEVDKEVIRNEENKLLAKALSKLKDTERNIVMLRFFEELSFADIARIIGKKEATVRVYLHRTLKIIKKEIINNEN